MDTDQRKSGVPDIPTLLEQLRDGLKDTQSQLFHKLKGRVFHLVGANNKIFQYRVNLDGEIKLIRRFNASLLKEVPAKAQRRFREAVTGDPDKRIRDHLKETPQVKMLDKISFTLGVLIICLTQWVIHRVPWSFPYYFSGLLSFLFISRFISYKKDKYHLFLLDFCYFLNVSTMLQAVLFPTNDTWFKINYVLSHGPILTAIVVWQNSLVFHSMDKVTSFFLHAFAPMYCHLTRWRLINPSFPEDEGSHLTFMTGFINPLLTYLLWQVLYIFIIECTPIASSLKADKDLITSYRYLTRDKKNSMTLFVKSICAKWGIDVPELSDGSIDPDTAKMKGIFFLSQFSYSLFTLCYVWIIYSSYGLSCGYIVLIFTWGTWNGASYYIEVFSKRYNLKFEAKAPDPSTEEEIEEEDHFQEALEMLIEDSATEDTRILRTSKDPSLSFVLSNDESKSYSVEELRLMYPQLLIDYLLESIGGLSSNEDKKDV